MILKTFIKVKVGVVVSRITHEPLLDESQPNTDIHHFLLSFLALKISNE